MPASTIAALLDYETNIENALGTWLDNTLANVQVLTPRTLLTSDPILTTPRVTVTLQVTGTNPNQQGYRANGNEYDAHKLGALTLSAVISRNNTSQSLTTLRGGIRQAMLSATAALNSNNLAYYQVVTLREQSSDTGPNGENDEIACRLGYAIEWFIKPEQWPSTLTGVSSPASVYVEKVTPTPATNVTLTVTASNGFPAYTYAWNTGGSTTNVFTGSYLTADFDAVCTITDGTGATYVVTVPIYIGLV